MGGDGREIVSRATLFACALTLSACAQPNAPEPAGTELPVLRLQTEPYSLEFNSGLRKPERLAIRDVAGWGKVWAEIYEHRGSKPPLPAIDFTKEIVIVAALGERPTGGYSILVTGASRAGNVITVRVESQSPGPGCGVLLSTSEPVDVARIPLSVAHVEFDETAFVRSCR